MFSQQESRDELGLGRIRDALSDTLFPGTSVLLTRARYLLFVPWLFRGGARRGYNGPQLGSWVERQERLLIRALRDGGDLEGLIGRNVGEAVQNLPSGIYWNSLRRFGILRHEGTAAQIAGLRQIPRPTNEATEFVEHSDAVWTPSIPEPPRNFFNFTHCDFALTPDEATWLAERIVDAVPETLLQFLVAKGNRHGSSGQYAWEDPEASAATGRVREAVGEARRFAVAMHGAALLYNVLLAALLYNVLLAERARELGLLQHEDRRDHFVAQLDEWSREIESSDLGSWDLGRLWALVAEQGRPVAPRTRVFVAHWVDLTRRRIAHGLADDQGARALVRNRELFQKGNQARLRNDRLMRQWGGASGSARLNFRWPVVARLLDDIADGREGGRARPR
jgi:hypothetical protein